MYISRGADDVKAYRIYIVGSDGRLQLGHAFEATDDLIAGARAETHAARGQVAELWEGGRMVGRVTSDGVFSTGDR
jgi:hypothetical protein